MLTWGSVAGSGSKSSSRRSGGLVRCTVSRCRTPCSPALNTIYFISELDCAFTELARVVKKSGRAIVGVGDPNAMAKMPVTAHGLRLRPIPEVIDALRVAGLTVVEDRRVGEDEEAFHLLVAKLTSPPD